jgi:hypothetical protein
MPDVLETGVARLLGTATDIPPSQESPPSAQAPAWIE